VPVHLVGYKTNGPVIGHVGVAGKNRPAEIIGKNWKCRVLVHVAPSLIATGPRMADTDQTVYVKFIDLYHSTLRNRSDRWSRVAQRLYKPVALGHSRCKFLDLENPMTLRLALFIGLALLAAGCAGQNAGRTGDRAPIMTPSDFYGFCSALPTPDACLSDPICQRYRQELANPPQELSACLAMCRRTNDALYTENLINGCAGILDRAGDLCDQFCRRRDRP
jgi:hypothetical protein